MTPFYPSSNGICDREDSRDPSFEFRDPNLDSNGLWLAELGAFWKSRYFTLNRNLRYLGHIFQERRKVCRTLFAAEKSTLVLIKCLSRKCIWHTLILIQFFIRQSTYSFFPTPILTSNLAEVYKIKITHQSNELTWVRKFLQCNRLRSPQPSVRTIWGLYRVSVRLVYRSPCYTFPRSWPSVPFSCVHFFLATSYPFCYPSRFCVHQSGISTFRRPTCGADEISSLLLAYGTLCDAQNPRKTARTVILGQTKVPREAFHC